MTRALVVGGSGAVGSLFAEILQREHEVTVADPLPPRAGLDGTWIEGRASDPQVAGAVPGHDVVVLCVPEEVAVAFVREVGAALTDRQLLVDTLSVKSPYLEAARAHVREAGVLSLNPMFAPDLGLEGRSVAVIRVRDNALADPFLGILSARGARLLPVDPGAHDRLTAALQVAGHAAVIAFGRALAALGYDAAAAEPLWTPPHRVMLALLARMGDLDPEVYRDIQASNPAASEARTALVAALSEMGDVARDPEGFARALEEALRPLGTRRDELAALATRLFRTE